MRVKLTAKHPRPTSATRSPVRAGTTTGRKPVRAPSPDEAHPKRSGQPADKRSDAPREPRAFKPRGDDSRPAFGERGPRKSFEGRPPARGERPSGGDERRPFKPRGDDSRPAFGERGPRKSFDDRPPRGERASGGDERRPFKPRGDDSRPAFGERGPRKSFDDRQPRGERTSGSDERRPFKPRGDDSRPAFGERGPRRSFDDRPPRGERASGADERRPFKPRGDDSRPAFNERDPRKSRDDRAPGARPARRDENDRPYARRDDRGDTRKPAAKPATKPAAPVAESAPKHRDHHDGLVRLSKVMSELGLCSRREADEWIEKGWVLVDGEVIDTLGTRIRPTQNIEILPAAHSAQARLVTILLHKPVGYVSGQAEDGYEPAVTLINPANHWNEDHSGVRFAPSHLRTLAPAGRLDIDSTGLLVLTQDGRIAKQLIGGHSEVDKEYLVRVRFGEHTVDVDQHFPAERLALLRHGLELDGVPLKTAQVSWQNGEQLRFVLREGKKRQIRRMCELVGLEVVGLKRIRMGHVTLGALPPGQWRYLGPNETF